MASLHFIAALCVLTAHLQFSKGNNNDDTYSGPEDSVTRCYKCEGDCNGSVGRVEGCYPDTGDSAKFVCYKLEVDGKTFQRGCSQEAEGGEQCIDQKGGTYCFCRSNECNVTSSPKISKLLFLLLVTFASFQRFFDRIL